MTKLRDKCYDTRQLQYLLNDQLDRETEAEVLQHMNQCPSCQQTLESLAADRALWDELPTNLSNHVRPDQEELLETTEHQQAESDANIKELLRNMGPTDDPNMLGRIGTYEICGVVGRGSTGIVLKSFEASLNRYVAIKVLLPTLSGNGAARRRFEREARAIAAVVNEHVVPIFAVDEHCGLPYFVMQYVSGASLQNRIERQGPLDACEVVRIAMQVASGLAAAHAQGIVHRDIKPANILLEHGLDRVLVSDFGLARVTDGATVTMSGLITGTPSYMAPEQARGDQIDQRSDLFSLGSVMYTMCTAAMPFPSETVYGVIRRICEAEPRSIRESNPEIPAWLESFIEKLLSKEKEDRFESAEQVAAILSHELAHLQNPTLVQTPPRAWVKPKPEPVEAIAPPSRFRRASSIWVALGLLAITAAVVLSNGTAESNFSGDDAEQANKPQTASISISDNAIVVTSGEAVTYLDADDLANARFASKERNAWTPPSPPAKDAWKGKKLASAVALAQPVADITVDGDASDWPADLPSYPIERAEVGKPPKHANDLSASFKLGYSSAEQALYVLVEVTDESLVIDAKAAKYHWDAQDGCELYIDKQHRVDDTQLAQYTRYGDSLNAYGSNEGVKGVGLIVGQSKAAGETDGQRGYQRIYEWRIDMEDGVVANKSMGFDLAILDKDADGSFTWLTWASGTQKIYATNHHGHIVLVKADAKLGEVTGNAKWPADAARARRQVRLQSLEFPELWVAVDCPESGGYRTVLPVGSYSVSAVDDADHRFGLDEPIHVTIKADEAVEAEPFEVRLVEEVKEVVEWQMELPVEQPEQHVYLSTGYNDSRNDAIAYAYPIDKITIDGDLSDWPEDIETYPIVDGHVGAVVKNDADLRARYRVGYNVAEQSLYVAVEVDDDSLVIDPHANRDWSAQDGNEIYLDAEHRKQGANVQQYDFYGNALLNPQPKIKVATGDRAKGRVFEWRIQADDVISAGRSLGFDVSVLDKDEDSSFTWVAWGRGTQKAWHGDRCGNLLLVDPATEFGTVTGKVSSTDTTHHHLPRVCLQSLDQPGLRPRIAPDADGTYTAKLPVGEYLVGPIGPAASQVRVQVAADTEVVAEELALTANHQQN